MFRRFLRAKALVPVMACLILVGLVIGGYFLVAKPDVSSEPQPVAMRTTYCAPTHMFCAEFPGVPTKVHQTGDPTDGVLTWDEYTSELGLDKRTTATYTVRVITGGFQANAPVESVDQACLSPTAAYPSRQRTNVTVAGRSAVRVTCWLLSASRQPLYHDAVYFKADGMIYQLFVGTVGGQPVDPVARNAFVKSFQPFRQI